MRKPQDFHPFFFSGTSGGVRITRDNLHVIKHAFGRSKSKIKNHKSEI